MSELLLFHSLMSVTHLTSIHSSVIMRLTPPMWCTQKKPEINDAISPVRSPAREQHRSSRITRSVVTAPALEAEAVSCYARPRHGDHSMLCPVSIVTTASDRPTVKNWGSTKPFGLPSPLQGASRLFFFFSFYCRLLSACLSKLQYQQYTFLNSFGMHSTA